MKQRLGLRLKSRKSIAALFERGHSRGLYPFRLFWRQAEAASGLRVAFSVPKRRFKSAVQRNRLRRQMKEAYRLHKAEFEAWLETQGLGTEALLLYVGKTPETWPMLEERLTRLLQEWPSIYANPPEEPRPPRRKTP